VWLRTWHNPVSVRVIFDSAGTAQLVVKRCDGSGGYEPGALVQSDTISLSLAETDRLRDLILKARFWELTTTDDRRGEDGAEWIFEGRKANQYHVTTRWTPRKGAYRELGVFIILRARLNIGPADIY
jgi:hypothetical protein